MSQTVDKKQFLRLESVVNPRIRGLFGGRVIDALTGEPPAGELTVTSDMAHLFIQTLGDGLFGCAGESRYFFPKQIQDTEATQDNIPAEVNLLIEVPGYQSSRSTVSIPINSVLPLYITVRLQRLPVRIQGHVVQPTATVHHPIPNARIRFFPTRRFAGVPETSPEGFHAHPVGRVFTPIQATIITLRTPLHQNHPSATVVQWCQLIPVSAKHQLVTSVAAGTATLTLSGDEPLSGGNILGFALNTERTHEYAIVEQCSRLPNRTLLVQLTSPLRRSFAATTAVQRCHSGVTSNVSNLANDAVAGDGVLYLTHPIPEDMPTTDVLKIADSDPTHVEYHALDLLTDDDGYYRIDGVRGVRIVYMEASEAQFAQMAEATKWLVDYRKPTNNVDFQLFH